MKNKYIFFGLLLGVIFYYWRSLFAFFQGDEWVYFSFFLPLTKQWNGIIFAFYKSIADANSVSSGAHLTPVYNIVWFLNNQFFGLNYVPYIISSIIVHVLNSFLVYIFVYNLTGKKQTAVISSIFFALSFVHQQSVTWIMAYIPTSLSVTFFLLCLIFLMQAISSVEKAATVKKVKLAILFFLLGLLTKETVVTLFILIPLIVILYGKEFFRKFLLRYYLYTLIFYALYRIGIPKIFSLIGSVNGISVPAPEKLELTLIIFRVFTYPLKVLAEVFVPGNWILSWAENLTPLAYPQYAKETGGSNFVLFTQGPGTDVIVYLIAVIFLLFIFYLIKQTTQFKKINSANALIIGLSIVVLSSYPLILIALYAPWWGYTSFIDSRHLYIASVGAGILFGLSISELSNWMSNVLLRIKIKISKKKVLIGLILIWSVLQYILLQKNLDQQVETGEQRKKVISAVLERVPVSSSKKIILVESDTAYYTFYAIPPFQTNLGQALMVYYYQMGELPQSFIKVGGNVLTKGDLKAQGIVSYEGKTFGYFIDKNTVFEKIVNKEFEMSELTAFHWNGGNNTIEDQTDKVRSEISKVLEIKEKNKDWREYKDSLTKVTFIHPPSISLLEEIINSDSVSKKLYLKKSQFSVKVEILKVPAGLGFYDVMKSYHDSDGNNVQGIIVKTFVLDPLHKSTVLMADSGSRSKYFIPTHHEVVSFLVEEIDEEGQKLLEQIIGSIEYKKDQ